MAPGVEGTLVCVSVCLPYGIISGECCVPENLNIRGAKALVL